MSAIDRETTDAALARELEAALAALERLSKYIAPRLTLEEQLAASAPLLHAKVKVQAVMLALTAPALPDWMERTTGERALATIHPLLRDRARQHDLMTIPNTNRKEKP